ncbi:MAG: GC-type dockerin domain-anchored protein [Phycisphaerales bacterium]|jgi:hypothetical protein
MIMGRTSGRATVLMVVAGLPASALAQGPLSEPFPAVLQTDEIDGEIGFVIDGVDSGDTFGLSVGALHDFNGDGIDDAIIGAPNASPAGEPLAGKAYVVFGSAAGFPAVFEASGLNGSNGFALEGVRGAFGGERAGWAVAGAGDVNGDGVGDAIIGADRATFPGIAGFAGKAYVVFGRQDGVFEPRSSLDDLDGSDGFVLTGVDDADNAGRSVSSAGDTNGDGIGDVIVGVPGRGTGSYSGGYYRCCPGAGYVIFGRDAASGAAFDAREPLGPVLPRDDGYAINGGDLEGDAGFAVASAGDVNGDGLTDLVLSAPDVDTYYGECYVVFGRPAASASSISVRSLNGTNGFRLTAPQASPFNHIGRFVDTAGDFNGDGIDDVLIGTFAGAFVVFGRDDGFPAEVDLGALDGTDGLWLRAFGGSDVAAIGDVNGDGIDDVAVSDAYAAGPSGMFSGEVYVVFGSRDAFPSTLNLTGLDGSDGFRFAASVAGEGVGRSVSAAGDLNHDGRDDLLVGVVNVGSGTGPGKAIVVYGRSSACAADLDGDGELTIFDFLEFQNLFDAGDPRADFDGDGSLTIFDFLAFQNAFDAGCG